VELAAWMVAPRNVMDDMCSNCGKRVRVNERAKKQDSERN
jgi:hypothetical protein